MKEKILPPIPIRPSDFDALEELIKKLFKQEIYYPLLKTLGVGKQKLTNAPQDVIDAIQSGRITFYRGHFSGRFDAKLSKDLKNLGAEWDRRHGTFKIPLSKLSTDIKTAIAVSEAKVRETFKQIDKNLAAMSPDAIAEKLKAEKIFDTTIWKVNKEFEKNVAAITVAPQLSATDRARIAAEYTKNMQLYIRDFTEKEIVKLRKDMEKATFSGYRYEAAIDQIQKSYGVSENKAKFLARQETSLLMTKFKQTRYEAAGSEEYIWTCVHMPKASSPTDHTPGKVRYFHGLLDGKKFSWKNPPVVDENGNRKNPGQDYNCRCTARAIVRF